MRSTRSSGRMRRLLSGRGGLVFLAFGLVLYLAVGRFLGERADLPRLNASSLMVLAGALMVEFVAKGAFAAMFKAAVHAGGLRLRFRGALRAALVASGVARLVPAGGAFTPVAMAWTVRDEVPGTAGAALRTTVLTYGGLLFATGGTILWTRAAGLGFALEAGVVTAGVAGVAAGALLFSGPRWMGSFTRRLPARLQRLIGPTAVDRRVTLLEVGLLILRLGAETGSMLLALYALGIHLSPVKGIVVYGVAHLIGGLPGSPGGLGVIEAGLVGVLALFGVAPSVSLGPILVYRVIAYWIPAGVGVFAGASAWMSQEAAGRVESDDLSTVE
ncbi:MAG TPA: flippase-like domain-containing protein [Acidimicrobiia bacterium]|nr:flippase-like domain-containing protein [Acidimicrobiia bacterium]